MHRLSQIVQTVDEAQRREIRIARRREPREAEVRGHHQHAARDQRAQQSEARDQRARDDDTDQRRGEAVGLHDRRDLRERIAVPEIERIGHRAHRVLGRADTSR